MDFTSRGSWVPATPVKPIPTKRPLIPVSSSTSQADVPNGLEQIGVSAGFHEISTSWGLASQLQDGSGNEGAPALASASHADSHNVGQRPPALNNPMDRWAHAMPYGSLLAAADATAASRRPSLTQFMFAHIRRSQGMAAAPNQLLRNGNFLLPRIHSNGDNHHLSQISQYGFPVPVLPDLNSLPEKMASTGMCETMCSPSTPLTLDKNKRIQNSPPREVIDLVDESVSDGTMPGKEISMLQPNAGETEGLSSPNPVLLSQVVSSQHQEGEKNVIMPSEVTSLQQPEIGDRRGDIQGIDFSKSPQPKPRKKKHRPKVIQEGKPARTPKSVTPKPITPKQARKKESPTGKRKYVRKKTVPNSSEPPSYPLGEIVDPESVTVSKSVKRHLDFDSEEPQVRDGLLRSPLVFARNEVQDQDACASGTITSSGAQSVVSSAQVMEAVLENSPAGITFDLSSSANQMANKYIRIPETPTPPSQAPRRQQMRINHKPHGYTSVVRDPPPTPQPYRRELIMENLKKLARKHDSLMVDGNSNRALETGQTSQLHSSNNLVGEDCISRHINFTHANEAINCANRSEGTSRHLPYFPHIHKKRRTEKGQRELSSIAASSVTYIPSNCCKTGVLAQNNCEVFTFSETQRLTALEKQQASAPGCLSLFDQRKTKKRSKAPSRANNLTSRNATEDCNNLSIPVKPSGFNNTVAHQFSTPEKVFGFNNSQEREICTPRDNQVKVTTKKRTKKEQLHLVKSMSANTNLMCLEEHEAATCSYGYSRGKKFAEISPPSEISRDKNSHFRVSSLQDYQSSSNFKESLNDISPSGAIVSYRDSVNEIVQRLKCLNINRSREIVTDEVQNALVPYNGGGGMVVPYEGPFNLTKKRRPRPKVDLDPESNRVWKLLMGKESSDEGMDMDKEKWWQEERRIFSGRVDSFIARMRLVQGDRRFSQWKGSVVDSVVGVFLTQNVSDHLSSSAFMTLAARFPLSPKANNSKPNGETVTKSMENQACCSTPLDDCIKWQENTLGQDPCCQGSLVIPEAQHIEEKEMTNSNESLGSHTGGSIVDYSNGKGLDVRELEIIYQSPDSRTSAPVTVTGSTSLTEAEDRSVEDVVSSQNSVSSSQNSSEYLVQSADQIKLSPLSNSNAEDLTYGGICNGLDSSTSFMELLHMAESTRFPELPSHGNGRMSSTDYCGTNGQLSVLKVNKRTSALNQLDSFNGECLFPYSSNPHPHDTQHDFISVSSNFSQSCHLHHSLDSRLTAIGSVNAAKEANLSHLSLTASRMNTTNNCDVIGRCSPSAENLTEIMDHSGTIPALETCATLRKQSVEPLSHSGTEDSCSHSNLPNKMNEASSGEETFNKCSHLQIEQTIKFHQNDREVEFQVESTENAVRVQAQMQNSRVHETCLNSYSNLRETNKVVEPLESNLKGKAYSSQNVPAVTKNSASKARKAKAETEKKNYDWDNLRKQACSNGTKMGRSSDRMDSVDWEAVRSADVHEISETIRERGMNNMLSERIKGFLDRIVTDHGSIDLEWLRDVPPDMAKDYLLSIRGLGLKSVECVRLLTLHHLAFPVDTNVGRICVRLGWVPIQPLPESLQLHLLELYPVLETIQKYIWPRLCKLDQRTLYELHYHMITFGKVFCTKSKPNCNACPMRGECKHFASAFASARFALPGPGEKGLVSSTIPIAFETGHSPVSNPTVLPQLEGSTISREGTILNNCEPIIEEPATPEPEFIETSKSDIEDAFFEDPDEIPHIKLNLEAFTQNIQDYMQEKNMELQGGDISKALVVLTREAASIPMPKLKNVSRLRTEHQVYEIPDSHPLLEGMDQRQPDDPSHYLLAIWSPGETAQSTEPPKICCNPQDTSKLCDKKTCFACNNIREAQAQTVRGTLLIPCRTAMRGSFPLNGTYFQVNEVFADHDSSLNPIVVSRQWIWNLPRRTVYFGTSVPTIFKGLTTEGIQHCFWKGFVCVRGFDRTTRAPRPLYARLHFPASKTTRNKKAATAAPREEE